ncbi:MAG TPA: response regulator transcription factor, partial [Planctomycetaceae bacterium]|nr:response regulator transcription factor [Planctomycetaceae bacterium]
MPRSEANAAVPTAQSARILIVDDHPVVRRGLAQLIADEPDMEVFGEAATGAEALKALDDLQPDVVIVDISLKDSHGIELIKQIKARDDQVKMLVWSMHDESLYAERALRAGAMGYLNKEEPIDRVIEAIRQVLRGHVHLSSKMVEKLLHRAVSGNEPHERSNIETLSDRELEVFELIGQGLTT